MILELNIPIPRITTLAQKALERLPVICDTTYSYYWFWRKLTVEWRQNLIRSWMSVVGANSKKSRHSSNEMFKLPSWSILQKKKTITMQLKKPDMKLPLLTGSTNASLLFCPSQCPSPWTLILTLPGPLCRHDSCPSARTATASFSRALAHSGWTRPGRHHRCSFGPKPPGISAIIRKEKCIRLAFQ